MTVRVQLFAVARQLAGTDSLELTVPEGATVGDVRAALAEAVPSLAEMLPRFAFAVDSRYAVDETRIDAGAELACIPPVSGG